jgi:D-glucosaminate-6-phosphate ammonia-lyase
VGRPMKTCKEEVVGLVKAVELYVGRDHRVEELVWDRRVARIIDTLSDLDGVRVWRQLPYGIGQQIPHAALTWDVEALGWTHRELARALRQGQPSIAVQLVLPSSYDFAGFDTPEIRVHPHTLREGEEVVVAERIRQLLQAKA